MYSAYIPLSNLYWIHILVDTYNYGNGGGGYYGGGGYGGGYGGYGELYSIYFMLIASK